MVPWILITGIKLFSHGCHPRPPSLHFSYLPQMAGYCFARHPVSDGLTFACDRFFHSFEIRDWLAHRFFCHFTPVGNYLKRETGSPTPSLKSEDPRDRKMEGGDEWIDLNTITPSCLVIGCGLGVVHPIIFVIQIWRKYESTFNMSRDWAQFNILVFVS